MKKDDIINQLIEIYKNNKKVTINEIAYQTSLSRKFIEKIIDGQTQDIDESSLNAIKEYIEDFKYYESIKLSPKQGRILIFILFILAFYFLTLIINKNLPRYSSEINFIIFFLSTSFSFIYWSKKSRFSIIFKILSLFVILNFIVFPFIYLILIKYDNTSFHFDSEIYQEEEEKSIEKIEKFYVPKELEFKSILIEDVIRDSSEEINNRISKLNNGNIVLLDKYILSKKCIIENDENNTIPNPSPNARRLDLQSSLNIFDKKGNILLSIEGDGDDCLLSDNKTVSIKDFLLEKRKYYMGLLSDFNYDYKDILVQKNIWSYSQILSYTINPQSTNIMLPKSKIAILIFYLHQVLGSIIPFGLITGFIVTYLDSKRQKSANK